MATGDLVTENWMIEYAGVVFGGDSGYLVSEIDGLLDLPDLTSSDQALLRQHGVHPGDDFLGGRTITVTLELQADTEEEFNEKVAALKTATTVGNPEAPWIFQVPGILNGEKALVMARPRRRNLPVNWDYYHRVTTAVVEFSCSDPRIYSLAYQSATITVAETGGGLEFDAVAPFTFGTAAVGGTFTATNAGDFDAPVRFRVDGPLTNPRIEATTLGKTIALDLVIPAGQYVIFDTKSKSVLLNGTASRYPNLNASSQWFDLPRGDTQITFRAATTETGTLTAQWRSATV